MDIFEEPLFYFSFYGRSDKETEIDGIRDRNHRTGKGLSLTKNKRGFEHVRKEQN